MTVQRARALVEMRKLTTSNTGSSFQSSATYAAITADQCVSDSPTCSRLADEKEALTWGAILVDLAAHRVFCGGQRVAKISPTQFHMLCTLIDAAGKVISRQQLLTAAWGRHIHVLPRTVDVHVGRLRRALLAAGGDEAVQTVRGQGYMISANSL